MATQKEMQDQIDALEARLAEADSNADRVAELEAQLASQEAADTASADAKMVRYKNGVTGSIVRVDEETAKGFGPEYSRVK